MITLQVTEVQVHFLKHSTIYIYMENCSNNFFLIFRKIVTNRGALFIETYFYLTYLMLKILNILRCDVPQYVVRNQHYNKIQKYA